MPYWGTPSSPTDMRVPTLDVSRAVPLRLSPTEKRCDAAGCMAVTTSAAAGKLHDACPPRSAGRRDRSIVSRGYCRRRVCLGSSAAASSVVMPGDVVSESPFMLPTGIPPGSKGSLEKRIIYFVLS